MKQLVNVNLTTRTSDWTPPTLTFGESLTLAFAFTRNVNGNAVAPNLTFTACQAGMGYVDARPAGGTTCLQFGTGASTGANTTAPIAYNSTAAQIAAAINALTWVTATYGTCTALFAQGSWLLSFGSGGVQVPIAPVKNLLWPVSFVDVSAWQAGDSASGPWVQAVRFVQAPVSYASDFDVVLPDPPVVTPVQPAGSSGTMLVPAIQQLYVPPDFQGAYTLNYGLYQQTALLNPTAGPSDIQAALQAAVNAGITVTLPLNYTFLITFGGDLAGEAQPTLGVTVQQAPAGNLTITLPLDREVLRTALRLAGAAITVPLQVQITASEDGGAAQVVAALDLSVVIQPSLFLAGMETAPETNWLVPPSPTSYAPFGALNVLTTGQTNATTQGDGIHTSFAITHGLASDDVRTFVRQNVDPGYQLVEGVDYRVLINSNNQVTVVAIGAVTVTSSSTTSTAVTISGVVPTCLVPGAVLLGAAVVTVSGSTVTLAANANATISAATAETITPGAAAWRVQVFSAQTIAQWATGLMLAMSQVTGLLGALASINANLAQLNTLLPVQASLTATGTSPQTTFTIPFPVGGGILFARDPQTGAPITDPTKLPAEPPYLLPCINKATPDAVWANQAPTAGTLYSVSAAVQIDGGGRIPGAWAPAGGFVGSDGRDNYPVLQSGTTTSYFPRQFDLVIPNSEIAVNGDMFSAGQVLTMAFQLGLQAIQADSECRWVLVVERGDFSADTLGGPNTDDPGNLGDVTWDTAAPLLCQRLIVTPALITHGFGLQIANNSGMASVTSASTSSTSVTIGAAVAGLVVGAYILGQQVTAIFGLTLTLAGNASQNIGSATAVGFTSYASTATLYKRVVASAIAAWPDVPEFALRLRLKNFDTRDSVPWARGWISWALSAPDAGILGVTIQ